jgi:hypothetical protein
MTNKQKDETKNDLNDLIDGIENAEVEDHTDQVYEIDPDALTDKEK